MGLRDLIPDDTGGTGGRPKESGVGSTREVYGEPFLPEKDNTFWWEEQVEEVTGGLSSFTSFEENAKKIGELSDWVGLHPVEVRKKLSEYNIYETDWEEYIEYYSDEVLDGRVPGYEDDFSPDIQSNPWDDTEWGRDEEKDGGLHNLVD